MPNFDKDNSYALAVGMGVLSALFYALRNLLLKAKVQNYNSSMLMCYQVGVIGAILFPSFFMLDGEAMADQWESLLALALITTAIGHTIFLNSFKYFSVTTASIISSIQPVFGIIIGAIFLSEIPTVLTILGGILILSSVVIESIRSYR